MEQYKDIGIDIIEKTLKELFSNQSNTKRSITIYTGAGGMDIMNETFELDTGYRRIYITKAPRFIKLRTSLTGRKYKRIRWN